MNGERPIAGAIDTSSGELSQIARNIGSTTIGLTTELLRGARELMHADTRVIHLPSSIIHH